MLRYLLPLGALGLVACNVVIGLDAFSKANATASAGSGGASPDATASASSGGASPLVRSAAVLGDATPEGPIVALGPDYLLYGLVAADGAVSILNQEEKSPPASSAASGGVYGLFGDVVVADGANAQASPFTWERLPDGPPPHAMDAAASPNGDDGWLVAATQEGPDKPVNLTAYRRGPDGMVKVPLTGPTTEVTTEIGTSFQKVRVAVSPNSDALYVAVQYMGTITVPVKSGGGAEKRATGTKSSVLLLKYAISATDSKLFEFVWSFGSNVMSTMEGYDDTLAGLAATNDRALLLAEIGTAPNSAGFGVGMSMNGASGKRAWALLKIATANDGSADFQPAQTDVLACGGANDTVQQNSVHPLGIALCSTKEDETEAVVAFTSTCKEVAAGSLGSTFSTLTQHPFTHAKGPGRVAFAQLDTDKGQGSMAGNKPVVLDLGYDGSAEGEEGEVTAMSVGPSVDGTKGVLIGGHFFTEVKALDANGDALKENGEPIPLPETAGKARQAFVLQLAPGTPNGVGSFFVTSPNAPSKGSATVTSLAYRPKSENLALGVRVANGEVTFLGSTLQAAKDGAERPYLNLLSDKAFAPSASR